MDIIRTYYELEERKYSSNVVVRVDVTLNEKKKEVLHRTIVVIPAEHKKRGDKMADLVLKTLTAEDVQYEW